GRGHVLLAHLRVPAPEAVLPEHLAFSALDAPEVEVVAVGDVEEDVVAPDDRGRAGPARQRELPGDVFRRTPAEREVLLVGHAVAVRAAPVGPVARAGIALRNEEQSTGGNEETSAHVQPP